MRSVDSLLNEYGESHQNSTNKIIHWICVPLIFWSIVALLYCIRLPFAIMQIPMTAAHIVFMLVLVYYVILSTTLSIGMMVFGLVCLTICNALTILGFKLWLVAMIVFVAAWIGQFIGHHIEGKKPSFLKDIQFLLIGPAWLMGNLFKRLNIPI